MVGLNSQAEHDLVAFEQTAAGWPQVRECYMLAGENDFLLKIVARDWDAYQTFLTRELTALANVAHVKTALTIRSSKSEPAVPVDTPAEQNAAARACQHRCPMTKQDRKSAVRGKRAAG